MNLSDLPIAEPVFHQSVRTRLALVLNAREASFSELKTMLEITDGNLDAHLRKLSAAGYLHSRMVTDGRPHTRYRLSESGAEAFARYVGVLRTYIVGADRQDRQTGANAD